MRRIGSRLFAGAFVIWAAATLTFVAMRLLGDPLTAILGPLSQSTDAERQAIAQLHGFDQPLIVQYFQYLGQLVTFDFGTSYSYKREVTTVLAEQSTGTIPLVLVSLILAWIIALLGIFLTAGGPVWLRKLGSGLEIIAISTPQLWLAIFLLLVFAFTLGWFPITGGGPVTSLVLPAFAMALPLAGYLGQVTREAYESALEQPFVLTSRARGSNEWIVRSRHVLRHAAVPGLTVSGFAIGWLISGTVIVETVFGRPGLGATLLTAVRTQDIPLTGAIVLISAIVYVIANLLVDLLYPIVDPRIRTI